MCDVNYKMSIVKSFLFQIHSSFFFLNHVGIEKEFLIHSLKASIAAFEFKIVFYSLTYSSYLQTRVYSKHLIENI